MKLKRKDYDNSIAWLESLKTEIGKNVPTLQNFEQGLSEAIELLTRTKEFECGMNDIDILYALTKLEQQSKVNLGILNCKVEENGKMLLEIIDLLENKSTATTPCML